MKKKGEIVFRQLDMNDIPRLTRLFNSLFIVQKPESFFLWESFDYISPVLIIGAFYGEELIGTFGIQKRTLENGLVCGQAHWPAVAKEWQGKSIFSHLVEMVLEQYNDLDILFNFYPDKAKKQVENSLDMKMLDTPEMVLDSPEGFVNSGITVTPANTLTHFANFESKEKDVIKFDNNPEYRFWRYAQNPFYSYKVVKAETGEYAVVKNFTDPVTGDTYGDIVDIECNHMDSKIIKKLVTGACRHFEEQGMATVTTWAMPGTKLQEVLKELGFRDGKRGQYYFGLKVLNNSHEYLYDFSRWRLQQCDSQKY